MSRIPAFACVALLVAFGGSPQAEASPVLVGQGAFVSPTVVTFTGIANEELVTNQFAGDGVTFSGALYGLTNLGDLALFPNNGDGVIASNWRYFGGGLQGLSFTADFSSLEQRVGFYLENWSTQTATIELFKGGNSLGFVTYMTTGLTAEFVGVEDLTGFDRMVLTNTANVNGFYAIDNFQFEGDVNVPEPVSMLLFGTGLMALRAWTKRR